MKKKRKSKLMESDLTTDEKYIHTNNKHSNKPNAITAIKYKNEIT